MLGVTYMMRFSRAPKNLKVRQPRATPVSPSRVALVPSAAWPAVPKTWPTPPRADQVGGVGGDRAVADMDRAGALVGDREVDMTGADAVAAISRSCVISVVVLVGAGTAVVLPFELVPADDRHVLVDLADRADADARGRAVVVDDGDLALAAGARQADRLVDLAVEGDLHAAVTGHDILVRALGHHGGLHLIFEERDHVGRRPGRGRKAQKSAVFGRRASAVGRAGKLLANKRRLQRRKNPNISID